MAFRDYVQALLSGGLPAVLEMGSAVPANAQGDTRPEQTRPEQPPPAPTPQDRETWLQTALRPENTARTILFVTAGVLAVLGIAYIARR